MICQVYQASRKHNPANLKSLGQEGQQTLENIKGWIFYLLSSTLRRQSERSDSTARYKALNPI